MKRVGTSKTLKGLGLVVGVMLVLAGMAFAGAGSPAEELTQELIGAVEDLNLSRGMENSLISKLEAVIKSLDRGRNNAAVNQLGAFINQVEAQSGKKLSDEEADGLIEAAQEVIASIVGDYPPDYSGTYCLTMEQSDSVTSFVRALEIIINQSGSLVTATIDGITATGTVSGDTMTLSATIPDEGEVTIVITFASDGQTLTGTFAIDTEQGTITGFEGTCTDYVYPEGEPACILPVGDLSLVTGGQQYNSVYGGVTHTGLDFEFDFTRPNIIAPCDGVITEVNKHPISLGNIIFSVVITYNQNWDTFIAFEPYSPDPVIADMQEEEIVVSLNQVVQRGDLLGRLIVPSTEFPHIHWGVNYNKTPVCPRDYLIPEAQEQLDTLYESFGLLPVCLP